MPRLLAVPSPVVCLVTLSMPLPAQNSSAATSAPLSVVVPAFVVIGPAVRTTNAQEMSGDKGKIGPLWKQFMQGGAETIPGVIEQETIYAVYTHYESDETGAYDLILGKSVRPEQHVPSGMKSIHIPAGRYLVFPATGSSPDAIKSAWGKVYDYFAHHSQQQRAFTIDFEQHSSLGTKLYIAVR